MAEPGVEPSFEDAVTQLEAIVSDLESGRLPLEECLARFEQAVALSRICARKLEAAEGQITVLTAQQGLQPAPPELAAPAGEAREPWEE
jgi:exodeoxyribonuclease VII small subunit